MHSDAYSMPAHLWKREGYGQGFIAFHECSHAITEFRSALHDISVFAARNLLEYSNSIVWLHTGGLQQAEVETLHKIAHMFVTAHKELLLWPFKAPRVTLVQLKVSRKSISSGGNH
jgi:hypothetical protein